jgi:quercetin dioxygenase-like cupin family protein
MSNDRADPYVLAPGEVRRDPGSLPGIKAGSLDTGGLVTVYEGTLEPWASGPGLHEHSREDEAIYVLDGVLLVQIGEERREVLAGSFVWMPRGTPHTFANAGPNPLRLLGFAVPSGIEEFFVEQGAHFSQRGGDSDPDEFARMATRYGARMLGAPISSDRRPRR